MEPPAARASFVFRLGGSLALWTAVLAAPAAGGEAQPPGLDAPGLDGYVRGAMARDGVPGLAIVVTRGGRIDALRGYGRAGPDGRPVTADTPFALGSLSKSFTALAVLQQVEAGRLELDAPVQRYLPWFRLADADLSQRVTVRHLLQHTSGIPATADRSFMEEAAEHKVRALALVRPARPPGQAFEYANPNYQVLGLLVEQASGRPLERYIRERVFGPLRMSSSFTSQEAARPAGLAAGYNVWFGVPVAMGKLPVAGTAEGGLVSTAADLARYLLALSQDGQLEGARVLRPESVQTLLRGGFPIGGGRSYAMGWYQRPLNGVPTLSHGGSTPGYQSFAALHPRGEWGVAVLANQWSAVIGAGAPARIASGVVSLLAGREPPAPGLGLRRAYLLFDLVLLVLVVLEARTWRRLFRPPAPQSTRRLALSGMADLGMAAAVWWAVPAYFGVSLATLIAVPSDFGWLFQAGLALGIARGLLRMALAARVRPAALSRRPAG